MRPGVITDQLTVVVLIGMILFFGKKIYDYLHLKRNRYYRQIALSLGLAIIALALIIIDQLFFVAILETLALILVVIAASGVAFFVVKGVNERNRK